MPRIAMTDRFCATAKPRGEDRTAYFDATCKGLELLVGPRGKVWYFHFQGSNGKRARLKLGSFPSLSLAKARGRALEARGHVEEGKDARHVFAGNEASAMTVGGFIASYLDKHAIPSLRSGPEIARRLHKNVTAIIGNVKLGDLHKRDINRCLDAVLARKAPIEAARIFADLRGALRWGERRGDIDRSPMSGMVIPAKSKPRERTLSDGEIATLWKALPTALASKQHQRVLQLALATAQRSGELCGMRIDEIDFRARIWRLPGSRVKNGHAHTVPLSGLAVDIIKAAIADAGDSPLVFPDLSAHLMSMAVLRAQDRFGVEHFTAHDLRRTALTQMARLGVAPIVLGTIANHRTTTKAGITLGVYVHHGYEAETRQALDLWADRLKAITSGRKTAKVVTLRPVSS